MEGTMFTWIKSMLKPNRMSHDEKDVHKRIVGIMYDCNNLIIQCELKFAQSGMEPYATRYASRIMNK